MSKLMKAWFVFLEKLKTDSEFAESFKKRFWSKIEIKPSGCWEWNANRARAGYGCISFDCKVGPFNCHRVAFALHNPNFKWESQHILHKCDNPPCCNPEHLSAGTMKENMEDCIRKGRFKFPKTVKGEKNPCAKISDADRKFIAENFEPGKKTGEYTREKLSKKFGLAGLTIYRIWKTHCGNRKTNKNILNETQCLEIIRRWNKGSRNSPNSSRNLAKEFGVKQFVISNILHKFNSRHKTTLQTCGDSKLPNKEEGL